MKMSDVFDLPVSPAGLFARMISITCKNKNKYIAHAINNHDRLEQENAELKKALSIVHKMCSAMTGPAYSKLPIHNHVKKLLNK